MSIQHNSERSRQYETAKIREHRRDLQNSLVSSFLNYAVVYEVRNLEAARDFLSFVRDKVILRTLPESVKCYGMLVVDYMFKTLSQEFPTKIADIIVDVGIDHVALFTAIKLGFKNIVYTGSSSEAQALLKHYEH